MHVFEEIDAGKFFPDVVIYCYIINPLLLRLALYIYFKSYLYLLY